MEKRFLIFISSTYEDLKEEREMVTRAILDLNCFPARMENFPAAGIPPKDLIEKVMKECDYFVLIIGDKYGSISESGKSFTEEEYNNGFKQDEDDSFIDQKDLIFISIICLRDSLRPNVKESVRKCHESIKKPIEY